MRTTPLVMLGLGLLAAGVWASAQGSALAAPARPDALPQQAETADRLTALLPTLEPPDTACIDCHKNADLLKQIAEEPKVEKAPSEGSG